MVISIIILTYNQLKYTKVCIDSIRKFTDKESYELIVVDNNSSDGTQEWLEKQNDIYTIYNKENLGFPAGCNQGIRISKGDNILLLNNDTIVTQNWLTNLITCLYSAEDIGAVGPITNYSSNLQAVITDYGDDLEGIHDFARRINISNPAKWEDRLRLIGFCFLFKREILEKVGLLDEIYSPGNLEDDDYSFRIRKAGYRLVLCRDTFIHHFGSISFNSEPGKFNSVIPINIGKFTEKWGVNPEYFMRIRKDISLYIKSLAINKPVIMHLNCGAGGTLLDIKNQILDAELYGIEENANAIANTNKFAHFDIGKPNIISNYPDRFFDFIIMTRADKNIDYYLSTINNSKRYLKNDGHFLFCISTASKKGFKEIIGQVFPNLNYKDYETYIDTVVDLQNNKQDQERQQISITYYPSLSSKASLFPQTPCTPETSSTLVNEKKISFISCVNDDNNYQISKNCIMELSIPEGFSIELICIKESENIMKAYNQAMHASNAKYKVYLHQDVFIINRSFVSDIIDIFTKDDKIGLIGVAGSKNIPRSGIWWEDNECYGKVYDSHTGEMKQLAFKEINNQYQAVSLIDGLIMITQYDIPWREDIFTGWHFYDISQSLEFIKNGFQVVVPKQDSPWCIHDCGVADLSNYEENRKIFVKEYINHNIDQILFKDRFRQTSVMQDIGRGINTTEHSPRFVTLLPGIKNVHLVKDVGMIPYILHKYFNYHAILPVYVGIDFPYLNHEVKGLKIDYLQETGSSRLDGYNYLLHNARKIDILQLYHFLPDTLYWIKTYKTINPEGKVYLKLDANYTIKNLDFSSLSEDDRTLLAECKLISVETIELYEYLNKNWPLKIAYIPNGYFDYNLESKSYIDFKDKENIICTVGNIGSYAKGTDILLESFKLAADRIGDWKLKLIGPIEPDFREYIENYQKENPGLTGRIIFTGEIRDRNLLYTEYQKAKIFCMPSRWESFGISILEAMSRGCYIICSDFISANDLSNNGQYGDIFQTANVEQLSKLLIKNCDNNTKLEELCPQIQKFVFENFNWLKICERINDLLR